MKANAALQIIFAFFLGLVVVAFVGIGVNTFYPSPGGVYGAVYERWALLTGVILLVCATVVLIASLVLPESQGVLSNGILLGGVFTMVYAVGMAFTADTSLLRLAVVAIALAVTIAIGYLKFVRGHPGVARVASPADAGAIGEVEVRLSAVERKLDALGKALRD
ncbi:MAG: hypothetical protein R2722_08835 [Tessaracoccus sp.]